MVCSRFHDDLPRTSTSGGSPFACVLEPGIFSVAVGPKEPAELEEAAPVAEAALLPDILPVAN